jgi:hypothetical protein
MSHWLVGLAFMAMNVAPAAYSEQFDALDSALAEFSVSFSPGDAHKVAVEMQAARKNNPKIKFACNPNLPDGKMKDCLTKSYERASQQASSRGTGALIRACVAGVGLVIAGCNLTPKALTPAVISPTIERPAYIQLAPASSTGAQP